MAMTPRFDFGLIRGPLKIIKIRFVIFTGKLRVIKQQCVGKFPPANFR